MSQTVPLLVRLIMATAALIMTATSTDAQRGVYTAWGPWSPCDVTCGGGVRVRYRACYPIGADCQGSVTETEVCNLNPCPDLGRWSAWTNWTDCTKPCGIGMQTRYRNCLSDQTQCIGSNRHVRICNTNSCKVSGGWSAWNEWSECSEPCGRGVRYKDRTCEDPAPAGGGLSCRGPGTKVGFCFVKPCTDKTATLVSVFDGESYREYEKTFVARRLLSIFTKFSPEERDGLIMYRHQGLNDTSANRNDTVMLRIEDGRIQLFVQTGGLTIWMKDETVLEMGQWHNVFAAVVGTRIVLRVNNGIPVEKLVENVEMEKVDLDQQMFIGGCSEAFISRTGISYPGFVGWIATLRVDYEEYFLDATQDAPAVSEETNHPIYSHNVEKWDIDADELYPTFSGSDYTVFTCSECSKPDFDVEIVIKPFSTSSGLIWSNFGEEAGSYLMLFFRKNSLVLSFNLGDEKVTTITEAIPEKEWLIVTVTVKGKQAKLRINHEHAYILKSDGEPYRPKPILHFAGGELDYWTLVYLATKQIRGFSGTLFSLSVNKKEYNVMREVAMRETGRLVSALSSSVAAKYDEFHEPPAAEVEFQCDLSPHEEKLGVTGGVAFWLREGEIIQNFSAITIQKVAGMKHATKMTIRNTELGQNDGFYGCLLRTSHYEILVHVFGVSFDDANEIDIMEISETVVLLAALLGSLCVLIALFILLKSGLMRRFPAYNAIMQRMPSWFTDGHRKDFLLRHTCSLQRAGQLPPDYIQRLLTMQEKAIQTPSVMDLGRLYGQPRDGFNSTADRDSDYNEPIPWKESDGTVFPRPLIAPPPPIHMTIPEHIKREPNKYLPSPLKYYETSDSEGTKSKTSNRGDTTSRSEKSRGLNSEQDSQSTTTGKTDFSTSFRATASSPDTSPESYHSNREKQRPKSTRKPEPKNRNAKQKMTPQNSSKNTGRNVKFRKAQSSDETPDDDVKSTKRPPAHKIDPFSEADSDESKNGNRKTHSSRKPEKQLRSARQREPPPESEPEKPRRPSKSGKTSAKKVPQSPRNIHRSYPPDGYRSPQFQRRSFPEHQTAHNVPPNFTPRPVPPQRRFPVRSPAYQPTSPYQPFMPQHPSPAEQMAPMGYENYEPDYEPQYQENYLPDAPQENLQPLSARDGYPVPVEQWPADGASPYGQWPGQPYESEVYYPSAEELGYGGTPRYY